MLTVEPNAPKSQERLTSRAEADAMDLVMAIEGLCLFAENLPAPSRSISANEERTLTGLPVFLDDLQKRANALHELVEQIDVEARYSTTPAA